MPGHIQEIVAADVKCYHCGHISGQIIGRRNAPLRVTDFVPRPGYTGEPARPGVRLRCERCRGPVFFEDTSTIAPVSIETKLKGLTPEKRQRAA